jgi:hypothetical protein
MDQIQMAGEAKTDADLQDLSIETFQIDELTDLNMDAALSSISVCSSTTSSTCCG